MSEATSTREPRTSLMPPVFLQNTAPTPFAESAKLEQAIKANLPARRSAQRVGGRGLGYGG